MKKAGCSAVKPINITSATLVSSSVPETDYPAWAIGTTYSVVAGGGMPGDRVVHAHQIWENVQAPNLGVTPGSNALYWALKGDTNQRLMFDGQINTATVDTSPMEVVIKPGYCNSLVIFGLVGSTVDVVGRNGLAGEIVYTASRELEGAVISSLYEYFYEPFLQLKQVILTDLPTYRDLHLSVTITGPADVECGLLAAGTKTDLGTAEYGFAIELVDYSRVDTNAKTGVTTFEPGPGAVRLTGAVMVDNVRFNKVVNLLDLMRGKPSVLITTDIVGYERLTAVGFFRTAPLTLDNYTTSTLNVDFIGII